MTSNDAFLTWWREYERTGKLGAVHLGMTREDLRQLFGEPDDTAKGFRKRPLSGIWKYGEIEFHFGFEGELFLIFIDGWDEVVSPRVIAQATPPTREQLRIMGHDEASRLKSLATKAGLPEHRLRFHHGFLERPSALSPETVGGNHPSARFGGTLGVGHSRYRWHPSPL
jgi:hypothetical protein